ncbi:MAG TPA: hypothetical protein VK604_21340 [Bryobacteraceae bacterium]|nr:hypothetical protein [Bryobacteraceae bacterium]
MMGEPRSTAVVVNIQSARTWISGVHPVARRIGVWAADTAQQFGAVVSALMGPAVLSVYSFAAWSLADDLGWTDSFIFQTGAFSNWLVWLVLALLVNSAAVILRRQYPRERTIA